jgi:hypothetical protein
VTDDSLFGSHNFHALHAGTDGTVYVSWLDGRQGVSSAFVTHSTDGGATWAPNVRANLGEACPCCRTALATSASGDLYLAWRAVLPGNVRDIVVARSSDRGRTWSEAVRVRADNWVFEGCPHAGPSLLVDSTGAVHVAWWTGKDENAGVFYARSTDGARSFATAVPIGVASFSRPAHVQMAVRGPSTVAVAWDDGTKEPPAVLVRVSRDSGATFGAAERVSEEGVKATFPVVSFRGDELIVAWSQEAATTDSAHSRHAIEGGPSTTARLHEVGSAQVMVRRARLK